MNYQFIHYQVIDSLALITLNRPNKLNAVSLGILDELHQAVDAAQIDEQVRVIGITGAGDKAFAARSDLAEVKERDIKKAQEPIVQGLAEKLERCNKVSIAAINGICFGGGLEVALGCDLRLATPNATFATVFTAPFIERRRTHSMLSTQLWYWAASLCLLEYGHDLAV